MLIGSNPIVDRLPLKIADAQRDVLSRLEGRYRSHHATGTAVITRLNDGEIQLLTPVKNGIRIHVLSVYKMRPC